MNWKTINKPLKKLVTSSGGASSGRNSAGRITIWHRGGGSKRLHRNIDLKRSTTSVGIVERIEYDPNRSSKIALVRWTEGVQPNKPREHFTPSQKPIPGPITTTVNGQFPLSCVTANNGRKMGSLRDVFISAFSSPGLKGVSSLNIPRIAVAGARPAFFAPQQRGEIKAGEEKTFALSDVRRWKKDSVLWEHRSKRKAAVSWQSMVGRNMPLGFVKTVEDDEMVDQDSLLLRPRGQVLETKDRSPISYILATHEMKVGQMVMNCDAATQARKQRIF